MSGRKPQKVMMPARPWHRGCDDPRCTNCPSIPVGEDPSQHCLLCQVDKLIADPDDRLGAYLAVADYSLMSHGIPWHCFVDPCRKHNMLLPRGAAKMLDAFATIGESLEGPPIGNVSVVATKRMLSEIETQIQELHDERDTRREQKANDLS